MYFRVAAEVFKTLPTVCFGVVVARGLVQDGLGAESLGRLRQATAQARMRLAGTSPKEHPGLACYREAFRRLGFNPNKFPTSIEALVTRVAKGGELPDINPVVNVVNALCLKYFVPMGAHDLGRMEGDIEVRFARPGDTFTPFGAAAAEDVDPGELVYADGREVRTRRWIWRQGDRAKVTAASRDLFFPIDGFTDVNREAVLDAREELAALMADLFRAKVKTGFLDAQQSEMDLGAPL